MPSAAVLLSGAWKLVIACIAACATVSAALVSLHCVGLLPSSVNIVGTFSDGPWCVHS